MLKSITLASVLALAITGAPAVAQDKGHGNGNGHGRGGDRGGAAERGPGRGDQARGDEGRGQQGRDNSHRSDHGGPARDRVERAGRPDNPAPVLAIPRDDRGRRDDRSVERVARDVRTVDIRDRGDVIVFRREPDRGLITGCPPGLAKKNNGCLPPGQARQIARQSVGWDSLWARPGETYRYQYADGYLYRLSPQGGLLGYLPALGGALAPGAAWPSQYAYQPVSPYYSDYFRLNDRYNYRYADGVLYGVDPQTQAINQVAALLTGQQWTVGQPMPSGYDIYNVPYAYRGQYADTPQSLYRYNDGYVYRVDPTTQLVQAAIQLLT